MDKTEIRQQQLLECEHQIKEIEPLWREGWTAHKLSFSLNAARERLQSSKNVERYVAVGGKMVQSTDELEALMMAVQVLELMVKLKGKEPEHELKHLLRTKIKLLQETLGESEDLLLHH